MIGFAITVLLTAVFLKFIASVLPDIEIDGFGPALTLAIIMAGADNVVGLAVGALFLPFLSSGGWVTVALFSFAVPMVVLVIALNFVPDVKVGSMSTVIIAAALLAALRTAVGLALGFAAMSRAG